MYKSDTELVFVVHLMIESGPNYLFCCYEGHRGRSSL